MKFTAVIIYVNYLVIVASASSTEENAEKGNFLGFELIEYRLENLDEKISNSFDHLIGFVSKIQNNTEERLSDLKISIDANNYTLSTSLKRLDNTAITNQKLSDEKSLSMKADISKLSDSLKRLESTFIAKQKLDEEKANKIQTDTSKLLERIAKLETLGEKLTKNQKKFNDQNENIMLNLSLVANNTRQIINNLHGVVTSCKEPAVSGVFQMQNPKLKVYCEVDSFDGGWLVIQQRVDHTLSFNRNWTEYQAGFGTIEKATDFWLGLEAIHQITKGGSCELVVEMKNNSKVYEYARYSQFIVAGENEKYKLTVGGHSGTAGDQFGKHNSNKFTTFDNDNDNRHDTNCALNFGGGGWWYDKCYDCNLNRQNGGMWSRSTNDKYKLTYSKMMIRCR